MFLNLVKSAQKAKKMTEFSAICAFCIGKLCVYNHAAPGITFDIPSIEDEDLRNMQRILRIFLECEKQIRRHQ